MPRLWHCFWAVVSGSLYIPRRISSLQLSNWPPIVRFHLWRKFAKNPRQKQSQNSRIMAFNLSKIAVAGGVGGMISKNISICLCSTMTLHPASWVLLPATRRARFHPGFAYSQTGKKKTKRSRATLHVSILNMLHDFSQALPRGKMKMHSWKKIEIKCCACITDSRWEDLCQSWK